MILLAAALACAAPARAAGARAADMVETATVAVPPRARTLRVWIPKPPAAGVQRAELVSVSAP